MKYHPAYRLFTYMILAVILSVILPDDFDFAGTIFPFGILVQYHIVDQRLHPCRIH